MEKRSPVCHFVTSRSCGKVQGGCGHLGLVGKERGTGNCLKPIPPQGNFQRGQELCVKYNEGACKHTFLEHFGLAEMRPWKVKMPLIFLDGCWRGAFVACAETTGLCVPAIQPIMQRVGGTPMDKPTFANDMCPPPQKFPMKRCVPSCPLGDAFMVPRVQFSSCNTYTEGNLKRTDTPNPTTAGSKAGQLWKGEGEPMVFIPCKLQ